MKTGTKRCLPGGWKDPRNRGYFRKMRARYDAPMRLRRLARRRRIRMLLVLACGIGAVVAAVAALG